MVQKEQTNKKPPGDSTPRQPPVSSGMQLVHITPLSKGIHRETLTYFTTKDAVPGSLATIPLRKKTVLGLVIKTEETSHLKTEIKKADYSIKKISSIKDGVYFLPEFLRAGEIASRYFASTTGAVINALIPAPIIQELLKSSSKDLSLQTHRDEKTPDNLISEKYIFQGDEKERFAFYKSLIREEFAHRKSVFFCVPTVADIERATDALARGIEEYTYIFHSQLPKKEIISLWKKLLKETHPVLIVATGMFFSLPRYDIKTIILERENAGGYKTIQRPFFDMRTFSEFFARALSAKLIWGDMCLRTETIFRKEKGEFLERAPLKFRSLSNAKQEIIDMTAVKDAGGKEKFTLISAALKECMGNAMENNERAFLLVARRGLYPITTCSDCGKVVRCDRCDSPLVLHGKKTSAGEIRSKNLFLCHWCGMRSESKDSCENCSGWRLTPLGIGAEAIEKEARKLFSSAKIFRLDKDSAPVRKRALKIAEKFYSTPGGILIGTEMAIGYLEKKIETVGVVSIDSLFTLADFRISERVFSLLLRLRGRAGSNFIIQTRIPNMELFQQITQGNLLDFYRGEIALREKFHYPPFTVLIKISAITTKQRTLEDLEIIKQALEKYNPEIYPAFISKIRNRYITNILLRVKSTRWPDNELRAILCSLPPSFTIKVDPETIL